MRHRSVREDRERDPRVREGGVPLLQGCGRARRAGPRAPHAHPARRGRAVSVIPKAAFFDLGDTLVEAIPGEDHWKPVVMARVEAAFGALPWAEELYAADIRSATAGDPYRQETNRWLADRLRRRGAPWAGARAERPRPAVACPLPQ